MGDEYLVSLRGVRDAKNVDEAADFLTSAKGGEKEFRVLELILQVV